ncbi:uncharacterized protein LOC144445878 [Glandiceps talaboti]
MGCGSSKSVEVVEEPQERGVVVIDKTSPEYIIAVFAEFDIDGDGFISVQELKLGFRKMNIDYDDEKIYHFMRSVDTDGDGKISIREFAHFWIQEHAKPTPSTTLDKLIAMFREIDADGNGYITIDELKIMMVKRKGYYTDEQVITLMRAADTDGDGRISFEEFVRLVARLSSSQ